MVGDMVDLKVDDIDRRLVRQLIVSYLVALHQGDLERTAEVAQLLGRILDFSDEQYRETGLFIVPSKKGWLGLFSNGGTRTPLHSPHRSAALESPGQSSLTEAWEQFLLAEACRSDLASGGSSNDDVLCIGKANFKTETPDDVAVSPAIVQVAENVVPLPPKVDQSIQEA